MSRLSLLLVLLLWSALAGAAERILSYHSDIRVQTDGSMLVTEDIRVAAEGNRIKRGIYRDFPTTYKDRLNNQYEVAFEVLDVQHNGAATAWHAETRGNGVRVYVGRKDRMIPHGEHSYRIRYRTDRQLGYFATHDELYWNVTGTRWDFPILRATARVRLPGDVPPGNLRPEGYTGPQGSTGHDLEWTLQADGAEFATTRVLERYEGLTIVLGWPKGLVNEPTRADRIAWLLQDNRHLVVGGAGFIVLLVYYVAVWWRVGRDPRAGTLYPEYEPPAGYSPAALRFIREMGYDKQAFTVALVNLAVKGYLEIADDDGTYRVLRRADAGKSKLAAGEAALVETLFSDGDEVTFERTRHALFRATLKAHERALEENYNKVYFRTNGVWMIGGIALSVATAVFMLLTMGNVDGVFFTVFASIFVSVLGLTLLRHARRIYRATRGRGVLRPVSILIQVIVAGVIMTVMADFFDDRFFDIPWSAVSLLGLVFLTNYQFQDWLKAPTLAGRRLLDRVDGFRLYLGVAEEEELQMRNPPRITPQRFEELLPFAIAFGVEKVWGERFAAALGSTAEAAAYSPHWYRGGHFDARNVGGFSTSVADGMSDAIASSSTPPGSSSGGGGGGFSGGGGGGGGGGGW